MKTMLKRVVNEILFFLFIKKVLTFGNIDEADLENILSTTIKTLDKLGYDSGFPRMRIYEDPLPDIKGIKIVARVRLAFPFLDPIIRISIGGLKRIDTNLPHNITLTAVAAHEATHVDQWVNNRFSGSPVDVRLENGNFAKDWMKNPKEIEANKMAAVLVRDLYGINIVMNRHIDRRPFIRLRKFYSILY